METVDCIDLSGAIQKVPRDQIILRPASYAIILKQGKLLVVRLKATGKYHLPGGGVEPGERIREALKREVSEETALEIEIGRLVHFEELFFYHNPSRKAYQGLHFYFLCTPKSGEAVQESSASEDSAEKPEWRDLDELRGENFQILGETLIEICRQISQTSG